MPYKVLDRIKLYENKDTWPHIRVVQVSKEYNYDNRTDGAVWHPLADGSKSFDVIVEVADEKDALDNPIWRKLDLRKKEK